MYHEFYGLRERPFSLSPDPRFLYLADSHREALAHLLYGIEQGEGFIAITGEVGTGKTTLCRTLLQRIEPGTEVAFIFNPQLGAEELLQSICAELGLPTRERSIRELNEQLNRFLLAKKTEGRRILLLIDEAQNLPPETLEQVRMLSNLETDTEKLLQIVLIGQPELDDLLESPSLRQLRQRISVRWRLSPLTALETRDYVRHRLRIAAGGTREIFTELALREIHRRSAGIPRVVNLLCDRALLAGYAAGSRSIGLGLVGQAEKEMRGGARELAPPPRRVLDRFFPEPLPQVAAALVLVLLGVVATVGVQRFLWKDASPPPVSAAPPEATTAPLATAPPVAEAPRPVPLVVTAPPSVKPAVGPADAVPAAAAEQLALVPEAEPPAPLVPERVDLGLALARSSPAATTAAAVTRMVELWKGRYDGPGYLSLEAGLAELEAAGLSVIALESADVDALLGVNHPALVELPAVDGAVRTLLVTAISDDEITFVGLDGDGEQRALRSEFERDWNGRAWVGWRDFAELPEILRPGQSGAPVAWLQRALHELGHLAERVPSGVFDDATIRAVREFQRSRSLLIDGTVGPHTKMALYESLRDYAIPRLAARDVG